MPGFPNNQGNPAGAIPVYVTSGGGGSLIINDVSQAIPAATSTEVLPANASRRYLFIQCVTPGEDLWINMFGGGATPNMVSSFLLTAGQTYESGTYVSPEPVYIYSANGADVTVVEG